MDLAIALGTRTEEEVGKMIGEAVAELEKEGVPAAQLRRNRIMLALIEEPIHWIFLRTGLLKA